MNIGLATLDVVLREAMLFAAAGLLIGGIDDMIVDLCFLLSRWRGRRTRSLTLDSLTSPAQPGSFAIFIATWREEAVIGAMLASAIARLRHPDYRIYVAVYPNDAATLAAVRSIAARDARIRPVVAPHDGPTTKADNLNTLWRVLVRDDAAEGRATTAIVLHDAEDVLHPAELTVFDALLRRYAVVQLPVLPLIRARSLVSGHYADEFAYAHGVHQPVRARLGAALPLAGTGCAIAMPVLAAIAEERAGAPFDATSLTEDYELGLRLATLGADSCFARVRDPLDGTLVAVRAYFPDRIAAATRQKARWMTGIALAGWDRTGWARRGRLADHWMRMRDRRAPLSILILAVAYGALVLWPVSVAAHWLMNISRPDDRLADRLLTGTSLLLVWRLAMRVGCTASAYDWREACRAVPRFFVGNIIALLAAPRALRRYLQILRNEPLVWDKTQHVFPDETPTIA